MTIGILAPTVNEASRLRERLTDCGADLYTYTSDPSPFGM